jgi:hypothetical protein
LSYSNFVAFAIYSPAALVLGFNDSLVASAAINILILPCCQHRTVKIRIGFRQVITLRRCGQNFDSYYRVSESDNGGLTEFKDRANRRKNYE